MSVTRCLLVGALMLSCVWQSGSYQRRHRLRSIKADVSAVKISKKLVPTEVLRAFGQKYPTATITGQLKEKREGIVYYEIESIDSSRHRDVLFQADGTLVEVSETISLDDLPQFVRDSVTTKYRDVTILSAERSTRDSHIEYELVLGSGKKRTEVVVNAAGKVFKIH
ncbi:MAG TPA: hypothetical protein VGR15_04455 [Bacteroidota bacterium]|nr:hypothetical protein [Bacteroidota bacterium]